MSSTQRLIGIVLSVLVGFAAEADANAVELQNGALRQGQEATFRVTDAPPGATLVLVAGDATRPCEQVAGDCIAPAVVLASFVVEASGAAVVPLTLRPRFPVGSFVFQVRSVDATIASAPIWASVGAAAPVVLVAGGRAR